MSQATVQIVGHMVRFMPEEEKLHYGGRATLQLHAKVGAFVLVVADDPKHYHTLASRVHEKDNVKEDPGPEVTGPVMESLQKAFPFGTKITVGSRKDDRQITRYFLLEK